MRISHEEYLKQSLRTKEMELKNIIIDHRIMIEKHEAVKDMLQKQVDSITRQLEGHEKRCKQCNIKLKSNNMSCASEAEEMCQACHTEME